MSHAQVPKYAMTFGEADRLSMFPEYRFFSPALPYLFGRANDSPFAGLVSAAADAKILYRRFDTAVFTGMCAGDDCEWNFVLFAVEAKHWAMLENLMLGALFYSMQDRFMSRIGAQDVEIADPLYVDKHRNRQAAPRLQIVVFGVDSPDACWTVAPATDGSPVVQQTPPLIRTQRMAAALFDNEDPAKAQKILDESTSQPLPAQRLRPPTIVDVSQLSDEQRKRAMQDIEEYKKGN